MISFSMISFLIGAVLGQRFKVMVLIPSIAIVLVLAVGMGVTQAWTVWSIALMTAIAASCLQIGYLVGICIRHLLSAAWSQRSSALTSPETPARNATR